VQAPGLLPDAALRDSILETEGMREVAEHWRELTMAVVGIGSIEPSDVLADSGNAFSPDERAPLLADGAVGDICHRIFRLDGTAVRGPLDERVVAISEADLRRIPRRVGVAGGGRKVAAIRGALAGGWVNALVTDTRTAEALLAED
jgi:DNA-binding transcriptional regulator LsrR (DeoR family)